MSTTRSPLRFLALAALGRVALVSAALFDSPTPENLVRRSVAKATVLGNYVYIDGGEICQLEDGQINEYKTNPVNSTLSIDLSASWTTANVQIRTIPKQGPNKINTQVFTDAERGVFYSWGGTWLRGLNMTATTLWKFTADGSGGGNWALSEPANPAAFSEIDPGEWSAHVSTSTQGLAIGGIASGWTELYRPRNQVLGGMLTYNYKSGVWENGTINYSPYPTLLGGAAQFVPNYGPNGLVFVFGGYSPPVGGEPDIGASTFHDLETITFFDPVTKKKYTQRTTGDVPPSPRSKFCVSGAQSTEGGHEIFVFGGQNQRAKTTHHDAYVLSLPGFVWTKLPEPPAGPRSEQTCVVVGKRQILSIGGADRQTQGAGMTQKDEAPNGLLLFDMSTLKWKDSYDAKAAAYQRADAIKALYSQGSDKVEWADGDVQKLFATETQAGGASGGGTGDPLTSSSASGTNVGAIAGGVVGGVVALAAIAALVWFLRRKKKGTDEVPAEVDGTGHAGPVPGPSPPTDVKYTYSGHIPLYEAGYTGDIHEAGGDEHRQEMYTPNHAPNTMVKSAMGDYRQELSTDSTPGVAPVELYGGDVPGRRN
ncbi:hypothetical protein QBC39DRAFT_269751 [Podospora conica]|nr:hypothetical protein QBC39DRAFT_269751 [Schizothecium conicum]